MGQKDQNLRNRLHGNEVKGGAKDYKMKGRSGQGGRKRITQKREGVSL